MTTSLVILCTLLIVGSLGILLRAAAQLIAELRSTARIGGDSAARMGGEINDIREETGRIETGWELLSESAASWPRAAVVPREMKLLAGNVRALGVASALLSTLCRGLGR